MVMTRSAVLASCVLMANWLPFTDARDPMPPNPKMQPSRVTRDAPPVSHMGRRQWLEERLSSRVSSRRQRQVIQTKIQRMSPQQIDALILFYERKLEQEKRPRERAAAVPAEAEILRRRLNHAWAHHSRARHIGYIPIINWLPQGTIFRAGGVISADRRSARINATGFFSRIDRVDSFPLYGSPTQHANRQRRPTGNSQPQVWYDGLRTRYGTPPNRDTRR